MLRGTPELSMARRLGILILRHRSTQWSTLRRMANWRLVTTSYVWLLIVPVGVRLLTPFAGPREVKLPWIFVGGRTIHLDLGLPFSWEVFFIMAVCFAIGSVLFVQYCPKIVQEFRNFGGFRSAHASNRPMLDMFNEFAERLSNRTLAEFLEETARWRGAQAKTHAEWAEEVESWQKEVMDASRGIHARDACARRFNDLLEMANHESVLSEHFEHVRALASKSRAGWRCTVAVLLYAGLGLFLWVLAQNLWQVGTYWFPPNSPQTVYQVCDECDLDKEDVDAIIDSVAHAALTRTEKLDLFRSQFENPVGPEVCEPCAIAILDAAAKTISRRRNPRTDSR